jgi:hypothetical protein
MFIPVASSDVKQKNNRFPRLFGSAFASCRRILLSDPVRGFTCDTRIDLRIEPGPIPAGNGSTAQHRTARSGGTPDVRSTSWVGDRRPRLSGAVLLRRGQFWAGGKLKKKIPELRLALQGKLTEHHRFQSLFHEWLI